MYYAHTSHGSQLHDGLFSLESANPFYSYSLGNLAEDNAYRVWAQTIYNNWEYTDSVPGVLTTFPTINYSMYCWCWQLDEFTSEQVQDYLNLMAALETAYPDVTFIYMTGNAQTTGSGGYNRHLRNEQIRNWVRNSQNRVLYDFADLDSWWYNPSTGQWEQATYEYNGQTVPVEHPQFHGDECNHTTNKSCEQKGKAVWWMMARLSGWEQGAKTTTTISPSTTTTTFPITTTLISSSSTTTSIFNPPPPPPKSTTTTITSSSSTSPISTTTTIKISSTTTTIPPPATSSSSSTTTTSFSDICVIEKMYGENSVEAELFRYIRDDTLNLTPEGQEIVKLYYEYNPYLIKLINEDRFLEKELKESIDNFLQLIKY